MPKVKTERKIGEVIKGIQRMTSVVGKIKYQKILLEDPDKSEKENKYHCFIHYLIAKFGRILHIHTFVCNGKSGEGKKLLLTLLNELVETKQIKPRAIIILTPDAEAASFFVTKDIKIDQQKLEKFYEKLSLKQRNKDDPKFDAYIGNVIDALNKRIELGEFSSSESEPSMQEPSMQDQSELQSSVFDPSIQYQNESEPSEGGKRTRKFRKIKKRKYRKSTGKLIRFSSR